MCPAHFILQRTYLPKFLPFFVAIRQIVFAAICTQEAADQLHPTKGEPEDRKVRHNPLQLLHVDPCGVVWTLCGSQPHPQNF